MSKESERKKKRGRGKVRLAHAPSSKKASTTSLLQLFPGHTAFKRDDGRYLMIRQDAPLAPCTPPCLAGVHASPGLDRVPIEQAWPQVVEGFKQRESNEVF